MLKFCTMVPTSTVMELCQIIDKVRIYRCRTLTTICTQCTLVGRNTLLKKQFAHNKFRKNCKSKSIEKVITRYFCGVLFGRFRLYIEPLLISICSFQRSLHFICEKRQIDDLCKSANLSESYLTCRWSDCDCGLSYGDKLTKLDSPRS